MESRFPTIALLNLRYHTSYVDLFVSSVPMQAVLESALIATSAHSTQTPRFHEELGYRVYMLGWPFASLSSRLRSTYLAPFRPMTFLSRSTSPLLKSTPPSGLDVILRLHSYFSKIEATSSPTISTAFLYSLLLARRGNLSSGRLTLPLDPVRFDSSLDGSTACSTT